MAPLPGCGAVASTIVWTGYIARETFDFAAALSLVPCFTPVGSPESDGVSEAFVKALKRDYARVQPRPDALTVLGQPAAWIDDDNECHPHRGLRMRSPREFIRDQTEQSPSEPRPGHLEEA